jgi:hypothetical protein
MNILKGLAYLSLVYNRKMICTYFQEDNRKKCAQQYPSKHVSCDAGQMPYTMERWSTDCAHGRRVALCVPALPGSGSLHKHVVHLHHIPRVALPRCLLHQILRTELSSHKILFLLRLGFWHLPVVDI